MVAAVGVRDLVIVDSGDAVLIAERERAQEVKQVVERLRTANHQAATFHATVHRPWGSFTVLEDADDCKVKRLTVKPGGILSLQRHQRRSEHWTVVDGVAHTAPPGEPHPARPAPDRGAVRRLLRRRRHRAPGRRLRPQMIAGGQQTHSHPNLPLEGEGFRVAAACDVRSFPFKGKGRMGMVLF
jgi:quercetin dioxygenase-like cupin family protein